jgi:Tol biopolymer transport system component
MRSLLLSLCASILAASAAAQATRLTTGSGGGERLPVLSLDGRTVAYVAMSGGSRDVFTVPADGGAATRRTTNAEVRVGSGVYDSWPSLSIADDGNRITYWNAGGVHVLDLAANSDTVVASSNLLAYPQITGDGTFVVYEGIVQGAREVFVVSATGGPSTQLTTGSGAGRRLPQARGRWVVFQKPVGAMQEVFLFDLGTNQVVGPISASSGRGNRYARLSPDGQVLTWESVVNGIKELQTFDLGTRTGRSVTTNSLRGDRTAAPTGDREAIFELSVVNRELHLIDLAAGGPQALTSGTRAGMRRPSIDQHGTILVYQAEDQGNCEVFALRLCYAPGLSHYGQHGPPSTGVLLERDDVYRRTFRLQLQTSLPANRAAVLMIGTQSASLPLPNAPNNFLYVQPLIAVPMTLDPNGSVSQAIGSPIYLVGQSAYAQWGVSDAAANPLGWVTSKGVRVDFR